ncbi:MAG TPA: hypothetical protein VNY74_13715 [Edaphobacter sp.]|jgi:hypothetical protein|nr:hypothetical protein [Edaphobacter sp.]
MATTEQVEALKQIGGYKWLVAVEAGGIGLIASFATRDSKLCNAATKGHIGGIIYAECSSGCS